MKRTKDYSTLLTKYFIMILIINSLLAACSQSHSQDSRTNDVPDPKQSGYYLLDYGEQFRNISSIMMRRHLEQDFDSLENLYEELVTITKAVDNLDVTPQYQNAKVLLFNWMWNELNYYGYILEDAPNELILKYGKESIQLLTDFLDEMLRLGHDLD